jgi:hypothetical protein
VEFVGITIVLVDKLGFWSIIMSEVQQKELTARELLDEKHPVHKHFVAWLDGKEASKRQARKFLQAFPQYRG